MERIMEESHDITSSDNPEVTNLRERVGLQRLDIVLDRPQHVYYGGEVITGKVFLGLRTPTIGLGLRLKCKGEAQVYFTNRSAGFRRRFSAEETYLHEEIHLEGDGRSEFEIKTGVYPFAVQLPENASCSFEGRYGRVRYSIRTILDITKIYRFSADILSITVAPVYDLNIDNLAPLPMSDSISKTFMGHTEPLFLSVLLPVRGYVPGQTIPLKITLKNTSHVDVKKFRIVFKKVVLYRSSEKIRKHKEIVVEMEQPVEINREDYEMGVDVPAVPPSGTICNLIDVRYTLKVEACVDVGEWYYRMFHKNLKIRSSIIVGTIPLKNYEDPTESSDDSQADAGRGKSFVTNNRGSRKGEDSAVENVDDDGSLMTNSQPKLKYQTSRVYRSSKPDRDDPTGDEGDSDGEVEPYSPMYRVYNFERSRDNGVSG